MELCIYFKEMGLPSSREWLFLSLVTGMAYSLQEEGKGRDISFHEWRSHEWRKYDFSTSHERRIPWEMECALSDEWRNHRPFPSSWRECHCMMESGNLNKKIG